MDLVQIIKEQAAPLIANVSGLTDDKREGVLGSLSDSIVGGIKGQLQSVDGISSLTDLFAGKTALADNPIVAQIQNLFTDDAVKRLGIDNSIVQNIVSQLPAVISSIGAKLGSSNIDLAEILTSLTGKDGAKGGGWLSILKKILQLFLGKKK